MGAPLQPGVQPPQRPLHQGHGEGEVAGENHRSVRPGLSHGPQTRRGGPGEEAEDGGEEPKLFDDAGDVVSGDGAVYALQSQAGDGGGFHPLLDQFVCLLADKHLPGFSYAADA